MNEVGSNKRINKNGLEADKEGNIVQAVPLVEGKVNVGAGTYKTNGVIHCVEEGSFNVVWPSGGTPSLINCLAGEDFGYYGDVQIVGGKFHLS